MAYQGRAIVSFLTLTPACIVQLRRKKVQFLSDKAAEELAAWLRGVMTRARLVKNGKFLAKGEFRSKGFLGATRNGLKKSRTHNVLLDHQYYFMSSRISAEVDAEHKKIKSLTIYIWEEGSPQILFQ